MYLQTPLPPPPTTPPPPPSNKPPMLRPGVQTPIKLTMVSGELYTWTIPGDYFTDPVGDIILYIVVIIFNNLIFLLLRSF